MTIIKQTVLLFLFLFSWNAFARCLYTSIEQMDARVSAWAKVTVISVVEKVKREVGIECPMDVTFQVKETYRGKVDEKLHLNYVWRTQKPDVILFEKGKDYILAIEKVENGEIKLLGFVCDQWGVSVMMEQDLIKYLKKSSEITK